MLVAKVRAPGGTLVREWCASGVWWGCGRLRRRGACL